MARVAPYHTARPETGGERTSTTTTTSVRVERKSARQTCARARADTPCARSANRRWNTEKPAPSEASGLSCAVYMPAAAIPQLADRAVRQRRGHGSPHCCPRRNESLGSPCSDAGPRLVNGHKWAQTGDRQLPTVSSGGVRSMGTNPFLCPKGPEWAQNRPLFGPLRTVRETLPIGPAEPKAGPQRSAKAGIAPRRSGVRVPLAPSFARRSNQRLVGLSLRSSIS